MEGTVQALVNSNTREQLSALPDWKLTKSENLDAVNDVSRPEGWGDDPSAPREIIAGGIPYPADTMIFGSL